MGAVFLLARRLSLSSGGRKSSPAVRVAVAAVALSILVMMCAIAIVTGFKGEITDKVAGFNSHITIVPEPLAASSDQSGSELMTLTPTLEELLHSQPYITDVALQAVVPSILKTSDDFKGVYLKSLTGRSLINFIRSAVIEGEMPDYTKESDASKIVLSHKTALQLSLKCGDKVDTYFMTDAIRVRRLTVVAIFDSHFDTYDDNFAYGALSLVQEMGNISKNQGTSLAISVNNFNQVTEDAAELQNTLIKAYSEELIYRPYRVTTARQAGAAYFQWLDLLDMNVIVILVLMTIVACVTLVSGMLILMVDKIRFIALMSALGASRKMISRIFMLMAAKITLYGLIIGDLLSVGILLLQQHTHFIPLDPETYYIDFVPVRFSMPSMIILNVAVLAVIMVILIIPSRFAGKAAPARTLATE